MSIFTTIVCLAIASSAFGYFERFNYRVDNPCKDNPSSYFHPDPSNKNGYIQCDAFGRFYQRSCPGSLVWDDSIKNCNWDWAVSSSGGETDAESTTTTSTTTTYSPPTFSWSTTRPTTSTRPSSGSLCSPNPCTHGECIESAMTISGGSRRFACICDEGWFGKMCDKRVDDYTTTRAPTTTTASSWSSSQGAGSGWIYPSRSDRWGYDRKYQSHPMQQDGTVYRV